MKGYLFATWACLTISSNASTEAFAHRGPRAPCGLHASKLKTMDSGKLVDVPTEPILGMRPGTSGLRKKVEVWQGKSESNKHYVENFIQSLLDTAANENEGCVPDTILVAGDGRYFNSEAIQIICRVLAANGVRRIWVPSKGIMSTPAVSAAIRNREGGKCEGGIILTASHNPGGPGEDFGIKYNLGYGQPAGDDFTDKIYERTLKINSFKTLEGVDDVDINALPGMVHELTEVSSVVIIDPFTEYVTVLKQCFDFSALREFCQRPDFTMLFDGMHGAGGPFARRILVEELGLPESSLMRCNPLPDFGGGHPDPNLTYAADLIKRMGLLSDGSENSSMAISDLPTLGVANDGDGDRNLIAGAGCFVTPSDSLAVICDNWESIPHFSKAGGPRGVARSMPSSAALDVVAKARGIPCFCTPTGWKFFGNLMGSKELFGKADYTPFLCGEESFGTGSDHIREKDGLWAALAWLSILMKSNDTTSGSPLVSVSDIIKNHWKKYGRNFYCRYDYEGVASEDADKLMEYIRTEFVHKGTSTTADETEIKLIKAEEFTYTDPVDGSSVSGQGLILSFQFSDGDPARVVFRLSGTGSTGATIRVYLEKFEKDSAKHHVASPVALKNLATLALRLVRIEELTGRHAPTVIT
ncbi:mutase phosphoglucomutase [Phaeodactylum tricornutum CCAP 1055/1]|jgi:phosphoglucomutase|uniref:phosphoglucomutase (alpha-D-glucose-1,6-bisphosphate-dependent) n=3 Tax=Phaeodactylum tricornutum TaxID=2850 RepID=B7FSE5_PHATC|nr:mutase phosphoglucomutase [Phaeodactylum tricornutum CCAP 1055/1]EEC50782.1 mutase phosphoglucomutase [Phaeodactylum tricornutum CCAP 1055/1]|eukprot:XP_002177968.1 mutase phosphoglucomutase [Phaeodactylum tricornutum CCAP 1055/1]